MSETATSSSIDEIINFAIAEHERDRDQYANGGGNWTELPYHSPLWAFTRAVKSFYSELSEPDIVFLDDIDPEIDHRGGWGSITSELYDWEDIYMEFVTVWESIRYGLGESPLQLAWGKAITFPVLPDRCRRAGNKLGNYQRFVSLAWWLQREQGLEQPILLPCVSLALLMGVSNTSISRFRKAATKLDQYIHVVQEHAWKRRRATELQFYPEKHRELMETIPGCAFIDN